MVRQSTGQQVAAHRTGPLKDRISGAPGVSIMPALPAFRLSLRANAADVVALSKALGIDLPHAPKASVRSDSGRLALWLGPDEWLVIDEAKDPAKDLGRSKVLHSAVDISHRNTAILVSGKGARATLEAGCPQNLSGRVFPVGACSRTVMGKIEVVILRSGEEEYRVECWRSFSDYAFAFLSDAAVDSLA